MLNTRTLATVAAAAAFALAPAPAVANGPSDAENIRKLDIMLMVTSLRCRMGEHDFQPHYRDFSAAHLSTLNGAARQLESGLVANHGPKGAKRALDRISVGMANQYGQGHPWLECSDLKQITSELATSRDPSALKLAASELLEASPHFGGRFAAR